MLLDRGSIIAAAIALADEGGLAAVSVRKVAARLNAGPMRLYGYISTKDQLFDLMVDEVYAEIVPGERPGDWREALRGLAHRTRQAALRHEWLADLLGGRPARARTASPSPRPRWPPSTASPTSTPSCAPWRR